MITRNVVLTVLLAVAGTALAQQPPAAPPPPHWHARMEQQRIERMAVLLELTAAQRQQVQTILTDEHARMKPAMQQVEKAMKQARATHEAVHKETLQRLSSVLTPAQMKKLKVLMPEHGMMHGMMMRGMMMHHMGHGMHMEPPPPPPGPGAGPQ
ncbi:MAG: periplasmic heavy metal sensor [Steroidobacteraceae bacterium]